MTSVTGFTAERMLAMEAATIVDGDVVGDNLILTKHDGSTVDAGNVRGPTGSPGISNAEMLQHLPAGVIMDWIGTAAPTKYLGMTGQQVVGGRTLYPDLWAVLPASMKHANGDDIVFPNTKGRVSVGYDAADTDFNAVGKTGGEKTHLLITSEMPAHNHPLSPNPHYHDAVAGTLLLGGAAGSPLTHWGSFTMVSEGSGGSAAIRTNPNTPTGPLTGSTLTMSNTGGGGAHNNLQPFIAFMKIIKAA